MDAASTIKRERVIDVREINPSIRHTVIFQLFEHLDETSSVQLIADHDPSPCGSSLKQNTAVAAAGPISNKVRTSGASGCAVITGKLGREPHKSFE